MGNRKTLCVTFATGDQDAGRVADGLREYIESEDVDDRDSLSVEVGSAVDARAAVDDHVYAFGSTHEPTLHESWERTLRQFPSECPWVLSVVTMDVDCHATLYHRVGGEYLEVDHYAAPEGWSADGVIDYFAVEHGLRPLTYMHTRLD